MHTHVYVHTYIFWPLVINFCFSFSGVEAIFVYYKAPGITPTVVGI